MKPLPPFIKTPHRPSVWRAAIGGALGMALCAALAWPVNTAAQARPAAATSAPAGIAGPGNAPAVQLGPIRELLARGQPEQALARLEQALAAQPSLQRVAEALFLRGVALMDLQREREALAVFEQMTQLFPELPDPWNNLAVLMAQTGRLQEALAASQSALRADPSFRAARVNLGWIHLLLASQAWEAAAEQGPADPKLIQQLQAVRTLLLAR